MGDTNMTVEVNDDVPPIDDLYTLPQGSLLLYDLVSRLPSHFPYMYMTYHMDDLCEYITFSEYIPYYKDGMFFWTIY